MSNITTDLKQKSIRYVQLQLIKKRGGSFTDAMKKEMDKIVKDSGLSHEQLVAIATNEVVAQ